MNTQRKLLLVAGHDLRRDPGAVANGTTEAAEMAALRDLVAAQVRRLDPKRVVLLDNDKHSLGETLAWVRASSAAGDLLVDLHCNAAISTHATGAEAIVHTNTSVGNRQLAEELVATTARVLGITSRGVMTEAEWADRVGKGRGFARIGILHTPPRVVLLETFFLTNAKVDLARYRDNRETLAASLAQLLVYHLAQD
jgi:N-acetylmuramoyl-L-alanine amidase